MDIWHKHAERERRRQQFEDMDRWILAHPMQANFIAIGIAVFLFEISCLLHIALDAIAR